MYKKELHKYRMNELGALFTMLPDDVIYRSLKVDDILANFIHRSAHLTMFNNNPDWLNQMLIAGDSEIATEIYLTDTKEGGAK